MGLQTEPGEGIESVGTAVYMVDEQGVDALGVNLIAGDRFTANDVEWSDVNAGGWASKAILSRQLAEAIFPDDPGLGVGKVVYIDQNDPLTVAGVVDKLLAAWPGWVNAEHAILVPQHPVTSDVTYLIRAEPGRRDEIMPEIEAMLAERESGRIVQNLLTMQQTRNRTFDGAHALVNILGFTVAVLVVITSLGVAGLTSFNITRRIKQIGTRRALGASRVNILRYFLAENLLFTVIGVVLGTVLAIAINLWLVESFSVPRFSWVWTPVTMIGLIVMSQLAVLFPARRAARVPPAVATRTV
jgi:putative ABC transport system permease protein